MKHLLMFFILTTAASSFAAQNTIYCKDNANKIQNAFSEEGHFACQAALYSGKACFTGEAQAVADLINEDTLNWDEEWIEGARAFGPNAIKYTLADGPNELRESASMKRCTDAFFRR